MKHKKIIHMMVLPLIYGICEIRGYILPVPDGGTITLYHPSFPSPNLLLPKSIKDKTSKNPTRNNTEGITELPVFKNEPGLWSDTIRMKVPYNCHHLLPPGV